LPLLKFQPSYKGYFTLPYHPIVRIILHYENICVRNFTFNSLSLGNDVISGELSNRRLNLSTGKVEDARIYGKLRI